MLTAYATQLVRKEITHLSHPVMDELDILKRIQQDETFPEPRPDHCLGMLDCAEVTRDTGRHICILLPPTGLDLRFYCYVLKNQKIPDAYPIVTAKSFVKQVLEALVYLHEKNAALFTLARNRPYFEV